MPGVETGDGAIVAAGSVVGRTCRRTRSPAHPARVLRKRYDDADIDRLLRAAWWNWPVELVTQHARTIMTGTPAELERIAAGAGLAPTGT